MNIAILGYGVEGESVYNYYHAKYPDATFVVYDNKSEPKNKLPDGVQFVGGAKDFTGISADMAIRSPSIPPWLVGVSGEVTTMTREFMHACPAPIIGVTGTKGKGTTASLIASILEAAGKKVWLVGNIGVGAFDVLDHVSPDDIVVYELSSFQLWDLDVSPYVAVILGIEPEHLDVHRDIEDYVGAKAQIVRHQKPGDVVVYKSGDSYAEAITHDVLTEQVPYPHRGSAHIDDDYFYYGEQRLCSVASVRLPGVHNLENACAAISAVWPWVHDGEVIGRGLAAFDGLPHRLKFVREVGDVKYYDDSIATTPGSAIAALDAFAQPKVIILGGSYKGAAYDELAAKIACSNVRQVILIGDEAPRLEAALQAQGVAQYTNLGTAVTMAMIVRQARDAAQPGDVVILSPSCASFDMFRSYTDRGEQFIAAVQSL